jgi:Ca2+/Na+ antiporter
MNKQLATDLAWGVGIVVVALLATWARKHGYMDPETVTRLVIGLTGLMVASFGNRLPKTFVPDARAREARRVAAWSLVVSGLIYAGLWTFAPMNVAVVGGCAAILLGIAVTIGYCMAIRPTSKAA